MPRRPDPNPPPLSPIEARAEIMRALDVLDRLKDAINDSGMTAAHNWLMNHAGTAERALRGIDKLLPQWAQETGRPPLGENIFDFSRKTGPSLVRHRQMRKDTPEPERPPVPETFSERVAAAFDFRKPLADDDKPPGAA